MYHLKAFYPDQINYLKKYSVFFDYYLHWVLKLAIKTSCLMGLLTLSG